MQPFLAPYILTFSRSDRRTVKSIGLTILLLTLFLIGIVVATNLSGMVAVYSFYFNWQQYHYGKQNLGLALREGHERSKIIDNVFYLSVVRLSLMGLFTGELSHFLDML